MKKSVCAICLLLALLVGMLAGCGSASQTAEETTETETSEAVQEEPAEEETGEEAEQTTETSEEETTEEEPAEEETAEEPEESEAAEEPAEEPEESEAAEEPAEEETAVSEHQYNFPRSDLALLDYSNEYSLPLCEETETLTWMRNQLSLMGPLGELGLDTLQDLDAIQELQNRTNVSIEYTELDFWTAQEKMNIIIASGDLPDIISDLSYTTGNIGALEDEVIIDLTELLDEYSPNYAYMIDSNPDYASYFRNDGKVLCYQSPYESFVSNQGLVIRSDWLEELGLDVPTTYDEMYEVLKAFKTNYDVEVPIYMNKDCVINGLAVGYDVASYSASGTATSLPYYVVDGVVHCSLIEDGYRDYLTEMNRWYNEGFFDPDFISVDYDPMGDYLTGLVSADSVGVWCTSGEGIGNITVPISCVPNLTLEEGGTDHQTSTSLLTDSTNTYITTCCENVELAMRFMDYLYSEDGILFYNYGFEGEDYTIDENGEPQFTDAIVNNEYGVDVPNMMRIRSVYTLCSSLMLRYRTAAYNTDVKNEAWDVWSSNLDGSMFIPSSVSMNSEESETAGYHTADVMTYANEMIPQFITGAVSLDEWDSFVARLKEMGIEDCIAAEQSAYDRCVG